MDEAHPPTAKIDVDVFGDKVVRHNRTNRRYVAWCPVGAGPGQRLGLLRRATHGQVIPAPWMGPHRGRQEGRGAQAVVEVRVGEHYGARSRGDLANRGTQLGALIWITASVHDQSAVIPDH
jgi:hypothetical protein